MVHRAHIKKFALVVTVLFGSSLLAVLPALPEVQAGELTTSDTLAACVNTLETGSGATTFRGGPRPEPGEDSLINEDVNIITGLYIREYSHARNGRVDYITARQIVLSEYNEYWNSVVYAKEFPLFYWDDANQDGEFDMWVDQKVEGSPCDIVPYHTASGNRDLIEGQF